MMTRRKSSGCSMGARVFAVKLTMSDAWACMCQAVHIEEGQHAGNTHRHRKARGCRGSISTRRLAVWEAAAIYLDIRIGEATNPGPIVSTPGDGNCMFHSLGYWAKQDQRQVRDTVARQAFTHWGDLFPWDAGEEYCDFRRTALTDGAWGDGRHLAIASKVYQVRIGVVGEYPYIFGDARPRWKRRFGARREHYDVVADEAEGLVQIVRADAADDLDDHTKGSEFDKNGPAQGARRWDDTG